tara:strand:- start:3094 stop:4149 length:1056 start_codon:yes stop_codon:yes gene_type:complete
MSFMIVPPESPDWDALYQRLPQARNDVFYGPAFAKLAQRTFYPDHDVLAAILPTDSGGILYPFVRRDLKQLTGHGFAEGLADISGLYGRGGIVADENSLANLPVFHRALEDYCRAQSVICGFDRFHPILGNETLAAEKSTVFSVGQTVSVDLQALPEDILSGFKHSARKAVRKAIKLDVRAFVEHGADHLKDFLDIYAETMDRREANSFFAFSSDFIARAVSELEGAASFFYAEHDGRIVSCELVLHSDWYGHSFFGGTLREAMPLAANNVLKYEIIRFLKERDCRHFILGGGHQQEDGIFKYKLSFAPDGTVPSLVGGTVYDEERYTRLRQCYAENGMTVPQGRFQFYDQ